MAYIIAPGTSINVEGKGKPATATAIVSVKDLGLDRHFILSAGHTFWEVDDNKLVKDIKTFTEQDSDNKIENKWVSRGGNLAGDPSLIGVSYGRYHRPGDKLDSVVDCGLIELYGAVNWAQTYAYKLAFLDRSGKKETKSLTSLDLAQNWAELDPRASTEYRCAEVVMKAADFTLCDRVSINWPTCNQTVVAKIERVYLRRRSPGAGGSYDNNGTSLMLGASGTPLIRYQVGEQTAIVVGMFLGLAEVVDDPPPAGLLSRTSYEVFQHISMAAETLNLENELPQRT